MAGSRKRLACDEYHVAWICPVADLELLPARLMLDDEYEPPQYDTHYDENTYLFGAINGHAVVIATCPQGRTGNVNAGRLTLPMFKTFRDIRMVLLVGIGGGIPSPYISVNPLENVHLGDVVVGHPGDNKPACIYHESGRSKVGEFEITSKVQDPDWRLTNALAVLASDHSMKKTMFNEHLARLQRHEDGSRFVHPGLQHDKLFQAAYPHVGGYYSRCVPCNSKQLVSRPQRTADNQSNFVFHFGRIATGNAVIQDGEKREEIRSRCDGALCVEMEAAGVDASRPCLIIRGISDYADSHKSDVWRHYAAGKAAAFARELLHKVPSNAINGIVEGEHQQQDGPESKDLMRATEAPFLVPLPRPPSYVGRETQLLRLSTHISSTDSCRLAISGLGGCGKTALALEVAYRVRELQPLRSIFWVPAVSQTSFDQAFRDIGERLSIPNINDNRSNARQLVKARLSDESLGPWLLIIDNADDLDILYSPTDRGAGTTRLIDDLPYSRKGSIILTTRSTYVAVDLAEQNVVELGSLDEPEARDLIRTRLFPQSQRQVEDQTVVTEFLNMLQFFALAIVQAVAYINKNRSSLTKYIQLFKASERDAAQLLSREFTDQGRYPGTKNPVATTWYISFEQTRRQNILAAEFLSFMACVANTDIPASMLPETESELDREDAVGVLKAYGFVTQRRRQGEEEHEPDTEEENQGEKFDIHPLVHLATRTWLKNQDEWDSHLEKAMKRLLRLVPRGDIRTRKLWTPYLPHAKHFCNISELDHSEQWCSLIGRVAHCHTALGQHRVAEYEYRELLAHTETTFGEKHPSILRVLNSISGALFNQGIYKEAEQIARRTLALRNEIYGKEQPSSITSLSNLGTILVARAKFSEAERIHKEVLALKDERYGKGHVKRLVSMCNLAVVLLKQSKLAEAEQMFRETIESSEKALGTEHPGTLSSMSFLADTLDKQGRHREAEELYRETLSLRVEVLGKDHPVTLKNMYWIAGTLADQGKYQEAEEMYRKILSLQERKVLEKEDTTTLLSMQTMAIAISQQGRYQEAEEMLRSALKIHENLLGDGHTKTLWCVKGLARVIERRCRYEEALALFERAREGLEKNLGVDHPDTKDCVEACAFLGSRTQVFSSSNSDESSLSDGTCESLRERSGSEEVEIQTSTAFGPVADAEREDSERTGADNLEAQAGADEALSTDFSPDRFQTQVPSINRDSARSEDAQRQDVKKRPPPVKAKPSALKGVSLHGLKLGDAYGDEQPTTN